MSIKTHQKENEGLCVPGFDSWMSDTKDFKLVAEAPLSNARHIKGSSMRKLVEPLPE